jgi:hypothetical protein
MVRLTLAKKKAWPPRDKRESRQKLAWRERPLYLARFRGAFPWRVFGNRRDDCGEKALILHNLAGRRDLSDFFSTIS